MTCIRGLSLPSSIAGADDRHGSGLVPQSTALPLCVNEFAPPAILALVETWNGPDDRPTRQTVLARRCARTGRTTTALPRRHRRLGSDRRAAGRIHVAERTPTATACTPARSPALNRSPPAPPPTRSGCSRRRYRHGSAPPRLADPPVSHENARGEPARWPSVCWTEFHLPRFTAAVTEEPAPRSTRSQSPALGIPTQAPRTELVITPGSSPCGVAPRPRGYRRVGREVSGGTALRGR